MHTPSRALLHLLQRQQRTRRLVFSFEKQVKPTIEYLAGLPGLNLKQCISAYPTILGAPAAALFSKPVYPQQNQRHKLGWVCKFAQPPPRGPVGMASKPCMSAFRCA